MEIRIYALGIIIDEEARNYKVEKGMRNDELWIMETNEKLGIMHQELEIRGIHYKLEIIN